MNDNDFYNITKAISGIGKRLTDESSSIGDQGGVLGDSYFCANSYGARECGYNNDLIDNGGYYWFATLKDPSTAIFWAPYYRAVSYTSDTDEKSYGVRPVISLSESVYVTGGTGTIDDPYEIARD